MQRSMWKTWLRPGMLVKRWIALLLVSLVLVSLAIAMSLAWIYRNVEFPAAASDLVWVLTLQFIPHPFRELSILVGGAVLLTVAFKGLSKSLLGPLMERSARGQALAQIVAEHRFGEPRPDFNVVAIGGGTGLSTLLRGLKHCNLNITAIVTVADDGGSTGRIREEFNMPAPGDIRNCIVALADAESTIGKLFQYRFDQQGSQLEGHSFGNLFITALTQVTGSFEQAVIESARVLAVRGRVLPSTLENVTLCGELVDGSVVRGESTISHKSAPIKRVFLEPEHPAGYEPALSAILNADLVVLGPGSLYTSVLPNLMVAGVSEAIRWTIGKVVYVCNVATQPGETDHFGAADHIQTIVNHLGKGTVHYALVNDNQRPATSIKPEWQVDPVTPAGVDRVDPGVEVIQRDVVNDANPLRHDPDKLATALVGIARRPARERVSRPVRQTLLEQVA